MFYHKWVRTAERFAQQFFYFASDADVIINSLSFATELLNYVQLLASSLKY